MGGLAEGWSLLDPWFLGLVPVVWVVWLWRWRRGRAALPTAAVGLFDGLPRSLRSRLLWLPSVLIAVGLTALSFALARPVSREVLPIREQGVDILLLLDISSSMDATDMDEGARTRRVEAARDKAGEFARGRPHDRVGLMTYALFPELRCPLTLDIDALSAFLRGVDTVQRGSQEDRTAIGVALAQAVRFLEKTDTPSKIVVLLTDGQNNVDAVTPADAAKLAADAGVRVHTIGLGAGQVLMSPFGGRQLLPTDFSELERIAKDTGGRFFAAEDAAGLGAVYQEIDRMEKVEIEDPRYRTTDGFAWPMAAALVVLLLALGLQCTWIRGAP